jgi:hypothetical protein
VCTSPGTMLSAIVKRGLAAAVLMLTLSAGAMAQTAGPRRLITQAIDEVRLVRLAGNTRPEAKSENDLGPAPDDLHLDMYLQLKRSPEQDAAARWMLDMTPAERLETLQSFVDSVWEFRCGDEEESRRRGGN